jgi:hypothetical protein
VLLLKLARKLSKKTDLGINELRGVNLNPTTSLHIMLSL